MKNAPHTHTLSAVGISVTDDHTWLALFKINEAEYLLAEDTKRLYKKHASADQNDDTIPIKAMLFIQEQLEHMLVRKIKAEEAIEVLKRNKIKPFENHSLKVRTGKL